MPCLSSQQDPSPSWLSFWSCFFSWHAPSPSARVVFLSQKDPWGNREHTIWWTRFGFYLNLNWRCWMMTITDHSLSYFVWGHLRSGLGLEKLGTQKVISCEYLWVYVSKQHCFMVWNFTRTKWFGIVKAKFNIFFLLLFVEEKNQ